MRTRQLTDKREIESRLRGQTSIHLYEIGDLDDFFWPYTTWYSRAEDDNSDEIALIYRGSDTPVLLAFTKRNGDDLSDLLESMTDVLPDTFHAHLSEGLVTAMTNHFHFESFGLHLKMELTRPERLHHIDVEETIPLRLSDLEEVQDLYGRAYPDGWFDPRMLATNMYFGIRQASELVAVAGVHVYSKQYRVAALGNITTDRSRRGQGLATSVTARLCQELAPSCDNIGLNVKADNEAALACYQKLGFEKVIAYDEGKFRRRLSPSLSPTRP